MLANLHTWRRTLGIDPIKELLNRPGQKVSVEVPVERAVPVKRGRHDGALSASDAFVVSVDHLDYRVVVTIVGLRSVCVFATEVELLMVLLSFRTHVGDISNLP
jgi:hypothetical protein